MSAAPRGIRGSLNIELAEAITEARLEYGHNWIGGDVLTDPERLAVLMEEVGEVAREILATNRPIHTRDELMQVAACAIAWIQALDDEDDWHAGLGPAT